MVLVQAKESKYPGPCDRTGCSVQILLGKPYIFDTEQKKAYCSKECAEMATGGKVVENGSSKKSSGTWTKPMQDLWRKPDEAITATKFFHETVIPMILETCKKLSPNTTKNGSIDKTIFDQVSRLYEEIFLGKMQGGSKN